MKRSHILDCCDIENDAPDLGCSGLVHGQDAVIARSAPIIDRTGRSLNFSQAPNVLIELVSLREIAALDLDPSYSANHARHRSASRLRFSQSSSNLAQHYAATADRHH